MNNTSRFIFLFLLGIAFWSCNPGSKDKEITLNSPDKSLKAKIYVDDNQNLKYSLIYNDSELIHASKLGLVIDSIDYGEKVQIENVQRQQIDESYQLVHSSTVYRHEGSRLILDIKSTDKNVSWVLECEIGKQGFAFRYKIPGTGSRLIQKEFTSFKMPDGTKVWFFERESKYWKLLSSAGEWVKAGISEMPTISNAGPVQGLPILCEPASGGYLMVSEAACYDHSGMRLEAVGNNTFQVNHKESDGFSKVGEIITPWRVMMFSNTLNELVNNHLVNDLAPQPDPEIYSDLSYIKPGKCVWRFITFGIDTPEDEKKYVDLARELDFEYNLVDDGWKDWPNKWEAITDVVQYGLKKDVGTFIWKRSTEIDDPTDDFSIMRTWLDSIQTTGAVGVKVDYMAGDTKKNIDFEIKVLKEAAKRRLMVNFHGCTKPTGEIRTFPNEITREGIRGLELNTMGEGPIKASHNAALPFTRYVLGHADYTPFSFAMPGSTTWAHQLATLVAFNSPMNVLVEEAEFMLTSEYVKPALEFIKTVPAVWDETIVLQGSEIGELAALAKRKDNKWYVSILNGGRKKQYSVQTDFLPDGKYEVEILSDDFDAELVHLKWGYNERYYKKNYGNTAVPYKREKTQVNSNDEIKISLAWYGGCVLVFNELK